MHTTHSLAKQVVQWQGYKQIDAHEKQRGSAVGKPREKFVSVAEMLDLAKS
jgi:adrenodoxin-NADP+ reductase